jgi:hypothetical protein
VAQAASPDTMGKIIGINLLIFMQIRKMPREGKHTAIMIPSGLYRGCWNERKGRKLTAPISAIINESSNNRAGF